MTILSAVELSNFFLSGDRAFAGVKYLRVHMKNVHSPERTVFSCPLCDSKFLSLWTTGKHLQRRESSVQTLPQGSHACLKRFFKKLCT